MVLNFGASHKKGYEGFIINVSEQCAERTDFKHENQKYARLSTQASNDPIDTNICKQQL